MKRLLKRLWTKQPDKPDNRKLLGLLEEWSVQTSDEQYEAVAREIISGNGYFLIPTPINPQISHEWKTTTEAITLSIESIRTLHGKKVLGVFSSETALNDWAGKTRTYVAMLTTAILDLCERQSIERIIVDSGSRTMFVLDRNAE